MIPIWSQSSKCRDLHRVSRDGLVHQWPRNHCRTIAAMICYTGIPLSPICGSSLHGVHVSSYQLMLPRCLPGKGSCSTSCISHLLAAGLEQVFSSMDISYGSNTNHGMLWLFVVRDSKFQHMCE